jgi:hypothetical protein
MPLDPVSSGDPHVAAHNEEREAINDLEETVPLLMPKPSNPQTGDMLRYNGVEWVSSITRLFEGAGQPEGVVAAPVGSIYVQTDGTTGAVQWLKVAGVDENDNTGWSLQFADTKWLNILTLVTPLPSGSAKYAANLRRVNNLVQVFFDLDTPAAGTSWNVCTLPVGFRPKFTTPGALTDNNEAAAKNTQVSAGGVVNLGIIVNKRDRFNGMWFTDDPWPAVLPGVAL